MEKSLVIQPVKQVVYDSRTQPVRFFFCRNGANWPSFFTFARTVWCIKSATSGALYVTPSFKILFLFLTDLFPYLYFGVQRFLYNALTIGNKGVQY